MKAIQPISSWSNGQQLQATQLSLTIINDNLSTSATLYYQLLDDNGVQIAEGNLTIDGQDYIDWGSSTDVNTDAYTICANKLNIQLL
jgi:hypothetical protein